MMASDRHGQMAHFGHICDHLDGEVMLDDSCQHPVTLWMDPHLMHQILRGCKPIMTLSSRGTYLIMWSDRDQHVSHVTLEQHIAAGGQKVISDAQTFHMEKAGC